MGTVRQEAGDEKIRRGGKAGHRQVLLILEMQLPVARVMCLGYVMLGMSLTRARWKMPAHCKWIHICSALRPGSRPLRKSHLPGAHSSGGV